MTVWLSSIDCILKSIYFLLALSVITSRYFRDQDEDPKCYASRNVGNVRADTESTFEFGVRKTRVKEGKFTSTPYWLKRQHCTVTPPESSKYFVFCFSRAMNDTNCLVWPFPLEDAILLPGVYVIQSRNQARTILCRGHFMPILYQLHFHSYFQMWGVPHQHPTQLILNFILNHFIYSIPGCNFSSASHFVMYARTNWRITYNFISGSYQLK